MLFFATDEGPFEPEAVQGVSRFVCRFYFEIRPGPN